MTEGKHPRHIGRVAVFQALYTLYISNENPAKIIDDLDQRHNFDSETKEYVG